MYSMVLMAAMLPSGDTASFGKRSSGGCTGYVASNSCHGGGFLGLRNRGSSCHGGRLGGHKHRGNGCNGGRLLGGRKHRHGCHGAVAAPAPCGCCGSVAPAQSGPAAMPKPAETTPKPMAKPKAKPKSTD